MWHKRVTIVIYDRSDSKACGLYCKSFTIVNYDYKLRFRLSITYNCNLRTKLGKDKASLGCDRSFIVLAIVITIL